MSDDHVVIERRQFPRREEAELALRALYRDRWPVLLAESAHERSFALKCTLAARPSRDANLAEHLAGLFGIGIEDAAYYRRQARLGTTWCGLTLDHCWALETFACWIRTRDDDLPPVIIHVDAHDDLQAPSLFVSADPMVFTIPLGQQMVDLRHPETVVPAIGRGFVGIGGFLVPLLHALGKGMYLHVSADNRAHRGWLLLEDELVVSWAGAGRQPLARWGDEATECSRGIEAMATSDLSCIASLPENAPVLLDIDLDAFCDVYDDSRPAPDTIPTLEELRDRLTGVFTALLYALRGRPIATLTIAFSPGFFPSTLWRESLTLIEEFARDLLDADREEVRAWLYG